MNGFLAGFQGAVRGLRQCPAPVVGAPSGLAVGGGYEVLAHCDRVVAHANTVFGLGEAPVGLVPGGGGVKETYWRGYRRLGNWQEAARKTFRQIGRGATASSLHLAGELAYFDADRDRRAGGQQFPGQRGGDVRPRTGSIHAPRVHGRDQGAHRASARTWQAAQELTFTQSIIV